MMVHCRKVGRGKKDILIFATKEDHAVPSTIQLPLADPQPGLILPNGDINWGCPCLGGMATGPCGIVFRKAFSCFHHSTEEPKGSNCFELFRSMQECMEQYPTLYGKEMNEKQEQSEEGEVTEFILDTSVLSAEKPKDEKVKTCPESKTK